MPVNSNALIRFQVYDKCLRSIQQEYTKEDILNELRKTERMERKKIKCGKSRMGVEVNDRQFFKDLKSIEEEWGIEIERIRRSDKKRIYRYRRPDFSIFANLPKDNYLIKLRDAMLLLHQFKGLPHFDFLNDLFEEVEGEIGNEQKIIVEFDGNPDLMGLEHFSRLLIAIITKKMLKIIYNASYKEVREIILSPYFLKEYNNRWFLMGSEKGYSSISHIALDRIEKLDYLLEELFIETEVDFENEYFEHVIGVTIPKGSHPQDVLLRFNERRFDYIVTKPLHGSQRVDRENRTIRISVIHNRELESLILRYGSDVDVLEPESLRKRIAGIVMEMHASLTK